MPRHNQTLIAVGLACALVAAAPLSSAQDNWTSADDQTVPNPPEPFMIGRQGTPWWSWMAYCSTVFANEYTRTNNSALSGDFIAFRSAALTRLQTDRKISAGEAEDILESYEDYTYAELDWSWDVQRSHECRRALAYQGTIGG